jgi:alpha-1,2-glucosyltransferase
MFWKLLFSFCVCSNLIPTPLIEFRYFLIPFVLYYIHLDDEESNFVEKKEFLNLILYTLVNVVTFYLFLYKPFLLDKTESRFMW